MNWSISSLWSDIANAWSAENWPYTLVFWLIVGGLIWLVSRRREKPPYP